ncbi:hypothetical protein DFP73DRAFT_480047 [Morchella snyderi]|nr:hypothetical protein DFP73DRAFT_480047 [Morchella snyderi]
MSESSTKKQRTQSPFAPAVNELHNFKRTWPNWCTMESEPVIWTQLLRDVGAQNTEVVEVYTIDEEGFAVVTPAHGIIFCMVFNTKYDPSEQEVVCPEGLWFANQVEDNACGTYAIMNIIMNSPDVELSTELTNFKEYSKALTPPHKGLAVASFEFLKSAHNSFGRRTEMDDLDLNQADAYKASRRGRSKSEKRKKGKKNDNMAYHYIAYVHVDGAIWELDGLKRQPVKFETCEHKDWLKAIGPRLHERIALYPKTLERFTCLALVPERLPIYRNELVFNAKILGAIKARLQEVNPEWQSFVTKDSHEGIYTEALTESVEESAEVLKIKSLTSSETLVEYYNKFCIEQRDIKHKISEAEKEACEDSVTTERTRHDYEPFIREMSRILARNTQARDILEPDWVEKAMKRKKRGVANRPARGRPRSKN